MAIFIIILLVGFIVLLYAGKEIPQNREEVNKQTKLLYVYIILSFIGMAGVTMITMSKVAIRVFNMWGVK